MKLTTSIRLALVAITATSPVSGAVAESLRWFQVGSSPWFDDVAEQLQVLVDKNGHQAINKVCVVGEDANGTLQAYVYWQQENKLILWVPDRNDHEAMVDSRRYLDLARDVTATGGVGTSNYLLTRKMADSKIAACRTYGTVFVVRRQARGDTHG